MGGRDTFLEVFFCCPAKGALGYLHTVREGGDTDTWNKEYGAIYPQLLRQKPVQPLKEIHPLAHSIQTLAVWPHLLSEDGD